MSRHRRIVALAALTVVLGACGEAEEECSTPGGVDCSAPGGSPTGPMFTEPGATFVVTVGERVTIVLESNVTTGYSWELQRPPPADVVELVADVYVEPDSDTLGSPGRQEFDFDAVGIGTAEIDLWYVRTFDDPADPAQRASFTITVE